MPAMLYPDVNFDGDTARIGVKAAWEGLVGMVIFVAVITSGTSDDLVILCIDWAKIDDGTPCIKVVFRVIFCRGALPTSLIILSI